MYDTSKADIATSEINREIKGSLNKLYVVILTQEYLWQSQNKDAWPGLRCIHPGGCGY